MKILKANYDDLQVILQKKGIGTALLHEIETVCPLPVMNFLQVTKVSS